MPSNPQSAIRGSQSASSPLRKICVIGLGYIGLPTAAVLATHGFQVIGVDVSDDVVATLNKGDVHIEEPGLRTLVQAAVRSGNLVARERPEEADVFIISVPTPFDGKGADLSYVEAASRSIVSSLKRGDLVILESTVPPGTTAQVVAPILEQSDLKAGADFNLAHCPERVLPGRILRELVENDRVIGGVTGACANRARDLYASFVSGQCWLTDATTAEAAKLVENTYRDVNIAFANELSRVCARLGLNVWKVIELANRHPRVNVLQPGPGVGGHCISVDPWFLVEKAPEEAKLIRLSREINDGQPDVVVGLIGKMVAGLADPKVAILGLAYKADVDDTRESPSLAVIAQLKSRGYQLAVADPHVRGGLVELSGIDEALAGADLVVLLTRHTAFKALSPELVAGQVRTKQILDTHDFLDLPTWRSAGFKVRRLGVSLG